MTVHQLATAAVGVLLLVAATTATGCSTSTTAPASATLAPASDSQGGAAAAPTTRGPSANPPESTLLRDGDDLDLDTLRVLMAQEASGDPGWIEVMADLRTRSWLATRYPGEYDPQEVYAEQWVADRLDLIQESVDEGVYLDEPLPRLVSVTETRTLGSLTELDVVMDTGEAVVRRNSDDGIVGPLPGGGRVRGLFTLGPAEPEDSDRPWRIHSIAELAASPEDSTTAASEEDTG